MRLRLLAIVCMMTLTIAVDAAADRNRRNFGTLFNDRARREDFELFGHWGRVTATTTEVDPRAEHTIQLDRIPNSNSRKRSPRKSLESIPDEELFQNDLIDPESLKPHIRVKRRDNLRRSLGKSPSYVHRIPRRTYERFLSEEMNPADESEAEYGGSVDDDIDVPGVFLNDEITNKRNKLEDVYPDVKSHSATSDHSPPEFLKETRDEEGPTRRKREKEQESDCDYEEEGEEYYYDEEDETTNQKGEVQGKQAVASKDAAALSTARETVDESESNQEEMQTFENSHDATIEGVGNLNSAAREKYVVAVKGKSSTNSAAKKSSERKHEKPKPKKQVPAPKRSNIKKPPQKGKPHPPKKAKPRKPKSNVAALVDDESDQLKNQKGNAKCCGEMAKKEGNKISKTIVVKAIPRSESLQELQIYEKPSGAKKTESGKAAAKSNADMSMGEMKDLLTRLIGKVDDLRSLISDIGSDKVDRVEGNSHRINCIAKTRRRAAAG